MLSPVIRNKIEQKFGSPIRYPKDCDSLANSISKECRCKISGSTLKRLFGLIKGTEKPRLWTLDLLANYLNHKSWEELLNHLTDNKPVVSQKIESVNSKNLTPGSVYQISFGKNTSVIIEYTGKNQYEVVEQERTVLLKSDVVFIEKIQLHLPLLVKSIQRGRLVLDGVLIGTVTGTTSIKLLSKNKSVSSLQHTNSNSK
ncbi:MAG: hypothetical protein J0L87_01445 [Bacteroidetes bacterium]|nr:hypothetical protein [Bacteroidota bacterium]